MGKALARGFVTQPWLEAAANFVEKHPRIYLWLAQLESRLLSEEVKEIKDIRPVYISGLARSGTTILLESIARFPGMRSHAYKDYPFVLLPYVWRKALKITPRETPAPQERTHKDRIFVTSDSPEAMEEAVWMAFWSCLHDPSTSNVLDDSASNSDFDNFYRNHIRKLLLAECGRRYVAKGNYNLSRILYIKRLYPESKFIVTVRAPIWHVASLIKQQKIFMDGLYDNESARAHLRRVGHFEFGPDRRPINFGNTGCIESILAMWKGGDEVTGWAKYWAHAYRYVTMLLDLPKLAESIVLVRYEDLCAHPVKTLRRIAESCGLDASEQFRAELASAISAPKYYEPMFNDTERRIIDNETRDVAIALGY